ncbi:MAG: OmpA family protein [Hyphomicrobium sp.]|nr:OmpA family protein [Hyphomicrobium sp.]
MIVLRARTLLLAIASVVSLALDLTGSAAEDSALVDGIERDLLSRGRVRRGMPQVRPESADVIDKVFTGRQKRGLNLQEQDELYAATRELPQRDFEVTFELNSSAITQEAKPILDALGQALARADLKGNRIIIAGHTDRTGSWSYNKDLSQRRAEAVAKYLSENYGLDPQNLYSVGYSYDKLKNQSQPNNAENRRVEVINGGGRQTTSP